MEDELRKLAEDLAQMAAVDGSVIVAGDGTVVAGAMNGDSEQEGAVAVFLGNAAMTIGNSLALGSFDWGVVSMSKYRMLVVRQPYFFIGLLLTTRASPLLLATQVQERLEASG